ncbi:MAG: hypothetical protein AAFY15_08675, partial [Cyanobacteria bacterium J06648_11]
QLNAAIAFSEALLSDLAANADRYWHTFETAFGNTFDLDAAETLRQQWLAGEFDLLPGVEAIASEDLAGALGAYAIATDTVYVSQEFVNTATAEQVAAVLLEEIGHGLDARVNESDSAGDEGEIFSALARGLELSATQVDAIQQQDDRAEIVLDGQILAVEQATLTVDSTADVVDAADGVTTLREAIIAANGTAEADVITLGAGTFELAIAGVGEDGSATGDLDITSDITIRGAGAGVTIIDANSLDRVFEVLPGAKLTLEDVTVTGGSATGSFPGNLGGGIQVDNAELTLTNSAVSGNSAAGDGGGIHTLYSVLTVDNSTISGNSTAFDGGGIATVYSTSSINNSTVSGNSASDGGGIYNSSTALSISNSTLSGNSAGDDGGAIYNISATSDLGNSYIYETLSISNSTLSGNSAEGYGGAVFSNNFSTLYVSNSTVAANSAGGNGGGISNLYTTSTINNSTIAGNTSQAAGGGIADIQSTSTIISTIVADNSAPVAPDLSNDLSTQTVSNSLVESAD